MIAKISEFYKSAEEDRSKFSRKLLIERVFDILQSFFKLSVISKMAGRKE